MEFDEISGVVCDGIEPDSFLLVLQYMGLISLGVRFEIFVYY